MNKQRRESTTCIRETEHLFCLLSAGVCCCIVRSFVFGSHCEQLFNCSVVFCVKNKQNCLLSAFIFVLCVF